MPAATVCRRRNYGNARDRRDDHQHRVCRHPRPSADRDGGAVSSSSVAPRRMAARHRSSWSAGYQRGRYRRRLWGEFRLRGNDCRRATVGSAAPVTGSRFAPAVACWWAVLSVGSGDHAGMAGRADAGARPRCGIPAVGAALAARIRRIPGRGFRRCGASAAGDRDCGGAAGSGRPIHRGCPTRGWLEITVGWYRWQPSSWWKGDLRAPVFPIGCSPDRVRSRRRSRDALELHRRGCGPCSSRSYGNTCCACPPARSHSPSSPMSWFQQSPPVGQVGVAAGASTRRLIAAGSVWRQSWGLCQYGGAAVPRLTAGVRSRPDAVGIPGSPL